MKKKINIIGAGISGLASACYLAKNGYEVFVFEKNSFFGGRASVFKEKGFIFDKGPSWYMMPEVFEEFFSYFGKKVRDCYQLIRLPVNYRVFFADGQKVDITDDQKINYKTFNFLEKNGGKNLEKYLKESRYLYQLSMKKLVEIPYDNGFLDLLKWEIIKNFFKLDLFQSLDTKLKSIFTNQKSRQILSFTSVFLGGSPYNTPAFYKLVAHADFNLGVYYPIGGIHKIIEALVSLAKELGVKIYTKREIVKAEVKNGAIRFLFDSAGKKNHADIVVCASDMNFFQTQVIPLQYQSIKKENWRKMVSSPSGFIIYLGINKKLKNVSHHNLYFSSSWKKGFDEVFSFGQWPEDPSYYFHVPSVTDQSVAPNGKETIMILVPIAPNLRDDQKTRDQFYNKIINHFQWLIGEKIVDKIEVCRVYSVSDFKKEYLSFKGSAFGLAHTLFQTAVFRPPNKDRKINNLYYVGQFTNPGVGMPPALISAKITANLIKKYHG